MPRGRRSPPRPVPTEGFFGEQAEPSGGRRVGPAEVTIRPTGMQYTWEGQSVIQAFNDVLTRGFEQLAEFAQDYWNNEEWTPDRHPYMTRAERDAGFFIVGSTPGGSSAVRGSGGASSFVELQIGSEVPHAIFEEYGTSIRPGHFPLRNTLDRVAYRFSDVIRAAAREEGLV